MNDTIDTLKCKKNIYTQSGDRALIGLLFVRETNHFHSLT